MSKAEKQSLIASIEYLTERVEKARGIEAAETAYRGYRARNLYVLSEGDLWNILGDLQQMDTD